MITIGVDAHKLVHVAVAVDDAGRQVSQWRGPNSPQEWTTALEWAEEQGEPRHWGIEGAGGFGRGLAQQLVAAGETVYEINPRWTARGRRYARKPGKNDKLDALAVANTVRQEAPHLPQVFPEDETAVLDLLATQRQAALSEAGRLRNQAHALLLQLDPQYWEHLPKLDTAAGLRALERYQATDPSALQQERGAAVRRLAQRLRVALEQVAELALQLKTRTVKGGFAPLTTICGINLLTAGTLAGILGPGPRFHSDAELAAHAGVAPLETSSAGAVRHRLNRGGNRRLNGVLHMIALTQARAWAPARAYLARRVSEGKTRREAMRALKRFLVRAVWRAWQRALSKPLSVDGACPAYSSEALLLPIAS